MEKKITLATVKSFIAKNADRLFIRNDSSFDGMIDGTSYNHGAQFKAAEKTERNFEHTLGVNGAWFVRSGRDWFLKFEENGFTGIAVSNSCGSFVIAIKA